MPAREIVSRQTFERAKSRAPRTTVRRHVALLLNGDTARASHQAKQVDDGELLTNSERLMRIEHAATMVIWAYEQHLPLGPRIEDLRSEMGGDYQEPTGWGCPRCRDGSQLKPLSGEEFECDRRQHRFLVRSDRGVMCAQVVGEQASRFRGALFELVRGSKTT